MASSINSSPYYNANSGLFTKLGNRYIRSYITETLYPTITQFKELSKETGCSEEKLKRKFEAIRDYDKNVKKETLPSICQPTSSPTESLLSLPDEEPQLSLPIQFLNSISRSKATKFIKLLLLEGRYVPFINPEHVDEEINIQEIISFTSVTSKDGKYFHDWMTCSMATTNLQHHNKAYPRTAIYHNSTPYKFLQPQLKNFCSKNNLTRIQLLQHHILLRSKLPKKLPALSQTSAKCASHLCDTKGCLKKKHLILETPQTNYSRQKCQGVILTLKCGGANKHITQIDPCEHGIRRGQAKGDHLKYSCRKIQVILEDDAITEYYQRCP